MAIDPVLVSSVAILCLLIHLLMRHNRSSHNSTLPLPPGPRGFPLLGALPLIGPSAHDSLARLAKRYGPIMYLKMGTTGAVVASSPAAARSFLKVHDAQFANRPPIIAAKDITYNYNTMVFSNYGPRWKHMRKLSSLHMLGSKAFANWAPVRNAEAAHMLRDMCGAARRGEAVAVSEALVCALANVIGQVAISKRVFAAKGEESNKFKELLGEVLTGGGLFNIGDFIPSVAWMDLQGIQARLKKGHKNLDGLITKMVAEHTATAAERKERPDLIDLVTANRFGADGVELLDINIKGLIFDLFTAGTDTSPIIIEWALAELLKNPTLLRRAQSEMDQVIGRNRRLEESDIPNLPYLQAVCKEAMRKHPSTPLSIPHFSFEPCEVDGYYIPGNTRLFVNIWAISRDPDVWERPMEFEPERFLSGPASKIEPLGNDFELIPFGAGRRICVGMQAGMVFVQYYLGTLLHAFDWEVVGEGEIDMTELPGLVLPMAVPLKAVVTPRLEPGAYLG